MVLGNSLLNILICLFPILELYKSLLAQVVPTAGSSQEDHIVQPCPSKTDGDAPQKLSDPIKFFENCQKLSKGRLQLNLSDYHYLTIFITFVKPTLAYKYVQIQKKIPYKYKPTLADKYRDGTGLCMGGAENKHL